MDRSCGAYWFCPVVNDYLSEYWPNKFHNEGEQQTPHTRPEERQVGVSCIQPLLDVWFQEDHLISPNFGYLNYRMWGFVAQTPRTLPSLMLYHPVIKHISHMQEGHLHRKGSRNKHFQCLKDPSFHQPSERGFPILVFKVRKLVLRKVTGVISQTSEQLPMWNFTLFLPLLTPFLFFLRICD